jgi:hypothetical protein
MTAPDAYWEEAHAAFHHCVAEDARVWAEPEASDPGINGDPDAHAAAAAQADQELMAEWPEWAWPGELQQKYGAEPESDAYTQTYAPETEIEAEPEADLGHDYDGPELRSGTPEYDALYAEYRAWAVPEPEPEAEL